ncbi:phosphatase 2C-like domain-containing protein [Phakopsora pachyrhizi]|uniref:Protein phosphatase n=1 Tax=Phakopsora pachyrhizi TaxID=170000 RepID=A0AAV0AK86_PHAPC|nr:phosphatase 2C-like domain-containing protein [Phakopsora pachyrhizi]
MYVPSFFYILAICKFITAASYLGKPCQSEYRLTIFYHYCLHLNDKNQNIKLSSTSALKDELIESDYQGWVRDQKAHWIKAFLKSQASSIPIDFNPDSLKNSGHDWWFTDRFDDDDDDDGINHEVESDLLKKAEGSNEYILRERYRYVGVADGVGGWEDEMIDPAQVSQSLMYHSHQISTSDPELEPSSVISRAYDKMVSDPFVRGGASTALLARLDTFTSTLDWSNLGDSSLWIFKGSDLRQSFQTIPQTHYFNCPYQLTKLPTSRNPNLNQHFQSINLDLPTLADSGSCSLDDGDLILVCTDGLADNLWPEEVTNLIRGISTKNTCRSDLEFVHDLAHRISSYARMASFQTRRVTPFEIEARRNSIDDLGGGKVDDITLIVSLVRKL